MVLLGRGVSLRPTYYKWAIDPVNYEKWIQYSNFVHFLARMWRLGCLFAQIAEMGRQKRHLTNDNQSIKQAHMALSYDVCEF